MQSVFRVVTAFGSSILTGSPITGIGVRLLIAFLLPTACPFLTVFPWLLAYPNPTASPRRPSAGSPSPVAGFEARPIPSTRKIERPTAVRTVFERPVG
jgi:hypothetical protein